MRSRILALVCASFVMLPALAQKGSGRGSGKKNKAPQGHWQRGLPYSVDAAAAIKSVRKSGKMLAVYVGDKPGGGANLDSKRLWQTLKAVTNGRLMDRNYYDMHIGESESFAETWSAYFVWLNIYPRKVKGAVILGPFGVRKFRFKADRSGQFLIFRYTGERMSASPEMHKDAKKRVTGILEQLCNACVEHGPIAAPKAVEPLVKDYDKALDHEKRHRPGQAYVLFAKVVEAGKDRESFPNGTPMVATRSRHAIKKMVERAETEIAGAERATSDAAKRKALTLLLKRYSRVRPVRDKVQARLDALAG